MSIFKRFVLLGTSLLVVFASLSALDNMNKTHMLINITLGSIVALHNFLMIYKRATTTHVVLESEYIKNKKGGDCHD